MRTLMLPIMVVATLLAISLYATGSLFGSSSADAATLSPTAIEGMVTLKDKEASIAEAEQRAAALAAAEEAAEQAEADAAAAAEARARAEAEAAAAEAARAQAEAAAQAALEAQAAAEAAAAADDSDDDKEHKRFGRFGEGCDKDDDGDPDVEGEASFHWKDKDGD